MTTIDRLVPFYVWFALGFGVVSLFIAIINFGMILITLLTVKGISVPSWSVIAVAISLFVGLTFVGWFFVRYDIQNRIAEYQNLNMNPQIKQIADDVKWLKEHYK
jgi:hypothetical protein